MLPILTVLTKCATPFWHTSTSSTPSWFLGDHRRLKGDEKMVTKITTLLVTLMLGIIANVIYDYIKNYSNNKKVKFPF